MEMFFFLITAYADHTKIFNVKQCGVTKQIEQKVYFFHVAENCQVKVQPSQTGKKKKKTLVAK